MISEVLRLIADRGGAKVTEIRHALDLPAEMAAVLCIQLQDAGFVSEWELEPCHHQDPDASCSQCSGSACETGDSHGPDAFKQGCCGINAPFRITPRGLAYLEGAG